MMAAPQRLPVESRAAGPVFVLLAVVLILQTCGGRLAPAADGTTAREPQAHTATGFYFHPVLGIVAVYGNSTCVYQFAHPEVPGVKFTECRRLVEKAGEHMFFLPRQHKILCPVGGHHVSQIMRAVGSRSKENTEEKVK